MDDAGNRVRVRLPEPGNAFSHLDTSERLGPRVAEKDRVPRQQLKINASADVDQGHGHVLSVACNVEQNVVRLNIVVHNLVVVQLLDRPKHGQAERGRDALVHLRFGCQIPVQQVLQGAGPAWHDETREVLVKQHLGGVDGAAGVWRRATLDDLAQEELPRTGRMLHLEGHFRAIACRTW